MLEHGQGGVKLYQHCLPHALIVYSNHFLSFRFTVFFATWWFGKDCVFVFLVGVKPWSFGCSSVLWRFTDSVCYGKHIELVDTIATIVPLLECEQQKSPHGLVQRSSREDEPE